jgi:hypothetical protein
MAVETEEQGSLGEEVLVDLVGSATQNEKARSDKRAL